MVHFYPYPATNHGSTEITNPKNAVFFFCVDHYLEKLPRFFQWSLYYQPKECTIARGILQNYHTFALFDSLKMGNSMISVFANEHVIISKSESHVTWDPERDPQIAYTSLPILEGIIPLKHLLITPNHKLE